MGGWCTPTVASAGRQARHTADVDFGGGWWHPPMEIPERTPAAPPRGASPFAQYARSPPPPSSSNGNGHGRGWSDSPDIFHTSDLWGASSPRGHRPRHSQGLASPAGPAPDMHHTFESRQYLGSSETDLQQGAEQIWTPGAMNRRVASPAPMPPCDASPFSRFTQHPRHHLPFETPGASPTTDYLLPHLSPYTDDLDLGPPHMGSHVGASSPPTSMPSLSPHGMFHMGCSHMGLASPRASTPRMQSHMAHSHMGPSLHHHNGWTTSPMADHMLSHLSPCGDNYDFSSHMPSRTTSTPHMPPHMGSVSIRHQTPTSPIRGGGTYGMTTHGSIQQRRDDIASTAALLQKARASSLLRQNVMALAPQQLQQPSHPSQLHSPMPPSRVSAQQLREVSNGEVRGGRMTQQQQQQMGAQAHAAVAQPIGGGGARMAVEAAVGNLHQGEARRILNELMHKPGYSMSLFDVQESGPMHSKRFTAAVTVTLPDGACLRFSGSGMKQKKLAMDSAAEAALLGLPPSPEVEILVRNLAYA